MFSLSIGVRAFARPGLVRRFELLDERRKTAGERRRDSVVLGLEAVPNCPQPRASVANRSRPVSRVRPRLAHGMGCRYARERRRWLWLARRLRLKFRRTVAKRMLNDIPADPLVKAIGRLNRGLEAVFYRRCGRLSPVRRTSWRAGCRHRDAPCGLCFCTAAIAPRHG
jgi:hypothetical protein